MTVHCDGGEATQVTSEGAGRPTARPRALVIALLLCAWGTGVPPAAADRPAKADLVIGVSQFPSTFHPNVESMAAKAYILGFTHRPFTAHDPKWRLVPMLAVDLPTIENRGAVPELAPGGRRGVAVTYRIQPRATWGDGTPVTTRDVLFAWRVGRNPQSGVANVEFYRSVYRVEVVDEKTFTLHYDRLTFDYNALPQFNVLPAHLDEKNFADPANYKNRTAYDTDRTNPGLYFGPYRIAQVSPNVQVVLVPNPTWWGEKPVFRRIVVRVIENTAALEANLLSGAIDMIAGEVGFTVDQAFALERRQGARYRFLYRAGLFYEHIDLNLDNPFLKDLRVRQALLYAVDREGVSRHLFGGRQPVAHTFLNPLDAGAAAGLRQYGYDPQKAASLLDSAGWRRTGDGIRRNARGERLALEFRTTAGNRTRELVQQVFQNQWKRIGVDVRIRNEPARVFFGQTLARRKFGALALYASITSPESVPRSRYHSSEIPTARNGFAGQNYAGFRSAEADRLIPAIEEELDPKKRKRLWRALQELYVEELPTLPLFFRAEPYILPLWLRNVVPTGHENPTTLWVEKWRVQP
ncbi:MAG: peptide ABC transporter substrate-binding protein [Deltaproteobacteria bacterium]|nr:peptide ABC transporter substrate-binding protein [Deltaproteobacteria bacterium]